ASYALTQTEPFPKEMPEPREGSVTRCFRLRAAGSRRPAAPLNVETQRPALVSASASTSAPTNTEAPVIELVAGSTATTDPFCSPTQSSPRAASGCEAPDGSVTFPVTVAVAGSIRER